MSRVHKTPEWGRAMDAGKLKRIAENKERRKKASGGEFENGIP